MHSRLFGSVLAVLSLSALLVGCEGEKESTGEAPSASASGAEKKKKKKAEPAPKPAAAKGPFAPFGAFVNEAGAAAVKALEGDKPDAKWNLEATDGSDAAKLEGRKVMFTTAEIEAISKDHGYVRTNVYVFPDNTVRFVQLKHKTGAVYVKPTESIDKAPAVLPATTKTLIEAISGEKCALPLMGPGDKERLPGQPDAAQLPDLTPQLLDVCKAVKGKSDGWEPRFDDLTVMLVDEKTQTIARVRTSIRVKDGKFFLEKPRLR